MASTSPKPKKSILKSSNSIDHSKKELEWDEMNILATHHPPDKDYGFMKVDEPPTPYNKAAISDNEDEEGSSRERKGSVERDEGLDPGDLAARLAVDGADREWRYADDDDDDSEENDEDLTEEEKAHKKAFMMKRKMHYNEFQAVQLAKKLMAEDKDDEDEEEEDGDKKQKGASSSGAASQGESSSRDNGNNNQQDISDPSSSSVPADLV